VIGAASLLAGFAIFSFRLIGGGDAKLFAAAALWLGPTGILAFLVFTAIAGLCVALLMLAWSAVSIESEVRGGPLLGGMKPVLPYGYAIASGAILAMPLSSWGTVYSL
jgi:prepilin peptidase CpaA